MHILFQQRFVDARVMQPRQVVAGQFESFLVPAFRSLRVVYVEIVHGLSFCVMSVEYNGIHFLFPSDTKQPAHRHGMPTAFRQTFPDRMVGADGIKINHQTAEKQENSISAWNAEEPNCSQWLMPLVSTQAVTKSITGLR